MEKSVFTLARNQCSTSPEYARWRAEELERSTRLRKGFKGIWDRLTDSYQRTRAKNEKETQKCRLRDKCEKETLISKQLAERKTIQAQIQQLCQKQTNERSEFFKGMNLQYKNVDRQNEIRKLFEQERTRMQQSSLKNRKLTDYEPEM